MTRAQGLLKYWNEHKDKQNLISLEKFIDYQYENYKHIQAVSNMPIKNKAYWLSERF